METTPSIRRRMLLTAVAIGAVSCLVATVASYWYMTGTTPPAFYTPQIHRLATMTRYGNVPIEFIGLVWFVIVGLIYLSSPPRETSAAYALVFCSAVPIVATGIEIARSHPRTWLFFVAGAAALFVLIVASTEQTPPVRAWLRLIRSDAARIAGSPSAVTMVFGLLSATVVSAQFISLKAAAVSASEASDQVFKRWFFSQGRDASADSVAAKGIKIVIFTDYQCPACATTVPAEEAAIQAFRNTHRIPIEVTYRDFPLEPECNPTLKNDMHPAACEAAVAVRVVRARRGEDRAHEFGASLYHNRSKLTPEYLEARLSEYQLTDIYKREYAETLKAVAADIALGERLGVRGTPTSFINGVKMPNISIRNFEMALLYETERLSGGTSTAIGDSANDLRPLTNGTQGAAAVVR